MGKQRRGFSDEFKASAVERLALSEQTLSSLARELGIQPSLLQNWRRQRAAIVPAPPTTESIEDEVRRLRREIAGLREDREILKKAARFFAQESR